MTQRWQMEFPGSKIKKGMGKCGLKGEILQIKKNKEK